MSANGRHGSPVVDVVATRARVAARLVGRQRELELVLSAVAAGRDIVLEGPPGTSKTTMLKAITAEWGIPLLFVEGNADLTPAKIVGHHNPARVLREDYSADTFVDGPLVSAMRAGGFLYIEEFNRAPEDTLNTLLAAMADRQIAVPRVGVVTAAPTFRVVASMNPGDDVGTTRLSTSVHDRLCRLTIDYQDEPAEQAIVRLRAGLADGVPAPGATGAGLHAGPLADRLVTDAVALTRATRTHEDVRQGSSVRGAIDLVLVAAPLAALREVAGPDDPRYPDVVHDALVVALSGRIHLDEAVQTTPERVLREIWEDHFVLRPAVAAPG
ncbi:MoxR family ATPase [Kineosporia sp. R_H_3]|uniref:AAA family ATPase n=1 Tax=Kineosporia sp. R_H_3 TaxID=1961848 RepID=UPI000B4BD881|nr:MoxR family ATPase [Kineosporia sp. R_H_3]